VIMHHDRLYFFRPRQPAFRVASVPFAVPPKRLVNLGVRNSVCPGPKPISGTPFNVHAASPPPTQPSEMPVVSRR
jgi:hypothetical protein